MRKKISVIGEGVEIGEGLARCAQVTDDLHGADVVIVAGEPDLDAVRRDAPAAVLLVVGDGLEERCRRAFADTLFPRARVLGVSDPAAAAESIIHERDDEHEVVAMVDGEFARRTARLGRGGIRELL